MESINLSDNALFLLSAMYKNFTEKDTKFFEDEDFKLLKMTEDKFFSAVNELDTAKLIFNESSENEKLLYLLFEGMMFYETQILKLNK